MTRVETVSVIYQYQRVLLGMKKKKFGIGKLNGFGGEVEAGENLEQAAARETFEEAGIQIKPERYGEVLFQFQTDEQNHLVHFFLAESYIGTPKESDEMKPEWFDVHKMPYEQMWMADRYCFPLLLQKKRFKGNFLYDKNFQIVKYQLNEIESL